MDAVTHLAPAVGVVAACDVLGVARASFYRQRPVLGPPASAVPEPALPAARPAPARALSPDERAGVLAVLHEARFRDRAPAAVRQMPGATEVGRALPSSALRESWRRRR